MRRPFICLLVCLALSAFGQDDVRKSLTGSWEGELTVQGRTVPIGMTFVLDDGTLRGTALDRGGRVTPLDNVAFADRAVRFSAGSLSFEGSLSADAMSVSGKVLLSTLPGTWYVNRRSKQTLIVSSKKLFEEGQRKFKSGDEKGALRSLDECLGIHPRSEDCLGLRGEIYTAKGVANTTEDEFTKGLADLTNAIALNAKNTGNLFRRGMAYRDYGQYQFLNAEDGALDLLAKSIEDFTTNITLTRDDWVAYFARGTSYALKYDIAKETKKEDLADVRRALADFTQAIKLNPNKPAIYNARADAFRALGLLDRMKADREKAKQLAGGK